MEGCTDSDCPPSMTVVVHPVPGDQSSDISAADYHHHHYSMPPMDQGTLPLSLPFLDHNLPSPGLSSSMLTDNDVEEDHDSEGCDSGVEVPPLNQGSAGALTGGSLDNDAPVAGGMAVPAKDKRGVSDGCNFT